LTEKYDLILKKLHCINTNEGHTDEISLVNIPMGIGSNAVLKHFGLRLKTFKFDMSPGETHNFGDARVPFIRIIIVQLIDRDLGWFLDPDDFLGDASMLATETDNGVALIMGKKNGSPFGTILRVGAAIYTYGLSEIARKMGPDIEDLVQNFDNLSIGNILDRLANFPRKYSDYYGYVLEYAIKKQN